MSWRRRRGRRGSRNWGDSMGDTRKNQATKLNVIRLTEWKGFSGELKGTNKTMKRDDVVRYRGSSSWDACAENIIWTKGDKVMVLLKKSKSMDGMGCKSEVFAEKSKRE